MRKIVDLIQNRIENNMEAIRNTMLIHLPADRSFTYEEFISTQIKFNKKQSETLAIRNEEVRRSIDDLMHLVRTYPRENPEETVNEEEVDAFKLFYSKEMYQAILNCTQKSFAAMKRRLGSKMSTGFLFMERPFFDVDIELKVPEVVMNPRVDDIQAAINTIAKRMLQSSKMLPCWGMIDGPETYYEMIACDKEIVKVILLLTGSLVAIRTKVDEYMAKFLKYDFLWKIDLQQVYDEFIKKGPSLDDFEGELKKYMALEIEILAISAVHNIGSLSLESTPLKQTLRAEASNWKGQFAKNIHKQAAEDLKVRFGSGNDGEKK